MNNVSAQHFEVQKEEGGEKFVTLLSVVLVFFAMTVFVLSNLFLETKDSLGFLVPQNATFYVHASGLRASEKLLSKNVQIPFGIHPSEVAFFAVKKSDGGYEWGSLLTWKWPQRLTNEEKQILYSVDASLLDKSTFFLGDSTLLTLMKQGNHTSLFDNKEKATNLAFIRGFSLTQAYLEPQQELVKISKDNDFIGASAPVVMSIAFADSYYSTLIVPVSRISPFLQILGFAPPLISKSHTSFSKPRLTADFAGENVKINPLAVLFSQVDGFAQISNDAEGSLLKKYTEQLTALLSLPDTSSFRVDPKSQKVEFLLHYPRISRHILEQNFISYLNILFPDKIVSKFPDQGSFIEYRLNKAKHSFYSVDIGSRNIRVLTLGDKRTILYIEEDQSGGVFITNTLVFLSEETFVTRTSDFCEAARNTASFSLKKPLVQYLTKSFLQDQTFLFNFSKVIVANIGDKVILGCGYLF